MGRLIVNDFHHIAINFNKLSAMFKLNITRAYLIGFQTELNLHVAMVASQPCDAQ
jgi:hypothetical protein